MSINVNDKNLGHATAYAYYKAGGGTMTEAEFTEFMADFGTASQTAVEAAQAALASETAARNASTTATNKASEATTAAQTATTKAGEASTSASTATSAKDTAVSAASTATSKATEATTAAATATSAKTDAVAANTAAQSAKTAAQTAQTGAETAAASVSASAEQIATNTEDIAQLKSNLTTDIPIININYKLQNETNYTLETAINAVWDNFRDFVKKGAILTYQTMVGVWETRQFIVTDNIVSEAQWKNTLYWKPFIKNTKQCIVVAASDSSAEAKESADLSTNSFNYGINLINNALALLPNGGKVYLRNGTYSGDAGISISVPNITIEGESLGVTISRTSGNDVFSNNIQGTILRNIRATKLNLYNGSEYILDNCIINNELLNYSYPSLDGVFVPPSEGIDGINAEIVKMGESGGTILLGEGEYTGTTGLNFYKSSSPTGYKSNIRIVGTGYKTVIDRTDSRNDVIANNSAIANNILENVRIATGVQRTVDNPVKMLRLVSCWIGTKYVDESEEQAVNIVNVGKDRFFETYSAAYNMFYVNSYPIGQTARWEIHIWGHIVETAPVVLAKNYIDLIGHNAVVELRGKGDVRFTFSDPSGGYYGDRLGVVKNIHFVKTGCYNYYQNYCVYVSSDTVKFYNCIFENASSSPTPFDQRNYLESQEATAGARRHGIGIECEKWGSQCKTEFHDCIGIGSPYGFMNTRGWYIVFGSPKLFNCVGYGGGIGEFCHGIINHRSSQAELFNCIGYASKTAFRKSAGIRFQAAGSSHLTGCVGYGSGGTQYISEGVSAERVTAICTELGIDPSTYVVDGVVQYSALTDAICAKIENSDITLTPLNSNTEESYGISFWANNGSAKLLNCAGYVGSGNNSHGLHCIGNTTPTINGGYFGIKDMLTDIKLASNDGVYMYTSLGGELNDYTKYTITKLTVSITGTPTTENDVLYVQTDETPRKTICMFNLKNVSSIGIIDATPQTIAAGHGILVFIKRDGTNIQIPTNKYILHVQYNYADDNSSAVYIGGTANPLITNAIVRAADGCDAVEVENTASTVRMFDCALHGDVGSGVTFATKTAVNSSSNYEI